VNTLKDWFLRLSAREQIILVGSAIGLSLFLSVAFVLSPLAAKNEELAANNRLLAAELAWLQQAAADFSVLRGSMGSDAQERNLAQEAEAAARARGIRIDRLQAGKEGGVQVWLKDAEFSRAARWLHDMEYRGNTIIQGISITAARASGRVNVQARLQQ